MISGAQPGVFFYFVQIPAQTNSCFSVRVAQSVNPSNGPLFQVQQAQQAPQVHLYNFADCTPVDNLMKNLQATDGGVALNVCGATAGRTYIMSVKYNVKVIVGQPDPGSTCDYSFTTLRNGVVIDQINNALHLVRTRATSLQPGK
jgi:hypothetical protein